MDYWTLKKKPHGDPLWWSLDGVSRANVLAAYKFSGRNNQTEAMTDLTGNGYTLTNSGCSWSSANGITCSINNASSASGNYIDQSSLRSSARSIVIKYHSGQNASGGVPITTFGGVGIWLVTPYTTEHYNYVYSGGLGITHGDGGIIPDGGTLANNAVRVGGWYGSATLGFTLSSEILCMNGSAVSLNPPSGWTGFGSSTIPRLLGGYAPAYGQSGSWRAPQRWYYRGGFNVQAFAVYSVDLTQAQHQQIYKQMQFI